MSSQQRPHLIAPEAVSREMKSSLIESIYRFATERGEYAGLLMGIARLITEEATQSEADRVRSLGSEVLPHFHAAVKISEAFSQSAERRHVLQASLERLPFAAGLVDGTGIIRAINPRGRQMIESSGSWQIKGDRLICQQQDSTPDGLCFFPLASSEDTRPGPDSQTLPGLAADPAARVFFQAPSGPWLNHSLLQRLYQVTEAEARVAEAILLHPSVQEAADRLALKACTVREHLSSLYAKLGVQRKPELIRKLLFSQVLGADRVWQAKSGVPGEDKRTRTFALRDGRTLAYREYGDPQGRPVLLCHNLMGSSFEPPPGGTQVASELGLRLLVPDRPGYGDSDPQDGRSLRQWPDDVRQWLYNLGIQSLDIIGHSIGTQYAIACAELLPQDIGRVVLISAVPQLPDILSSKAAPGILSHTHMIVRFAPFLLKPILQMMVRGNVESFYENQLSYLRPQKTGHSLDIQLMQDPVFKAYCIENFAQSVRQGVDAWAEELKIGFSEWGFEPGINRVPYQIWHGDLDNFCTPEMVQKLAARLNVEQFFGIKDETHYLFSRQFPRILERLVEGR